MIRSIWGFASLDTAEQTQLKRDAIQHELDFHRLQRTLNVAAHTITKRQIGTLTLGPILKPRQ